MGLIHFLLESQFWFPIWVIFLLDKNFTLQQIVFADMIFRGSIVVLEFPLGVLGDRIGRKFTYFSGAILGVVTYLLLLITTSFLLLALCWIMWAFFWSMISGTNTAYRYELLTTESNSAQNIRLFGLFNSIAAFSLVLSHSSAGFLYEINPGLPIIINIIFALIAGLMILTLPKIPRKKIHKTSNSLLEIWQAFLVLVKKEKKLLATLLLLAIWTAFHWTPTLLYQPLLKSLGMGPESFGIIFALFTGMGIVSGFIAGKITDKFGKIPLIVLGIILQVIAVGLTAFARGIFLAIFGIVLLRFAFFLCEPVLSIILNENLTNEIRASVISLISLMASIIMIFSRPLVGLTADHYTVKFAFGVWFVMGILFMLISIFFIRKLTLAGQARGEL